MKLVLATIISLLAFTSAQAAEEIRVINENGDTEIFIPKSENAQGTTYISSGVMDDSQPDSLTVIKPSKPTIKVYQPEPEYGYEETIPMTITNEYQPLVDAGGNYDAGADVYRPNLKFKGY